MRVHITKKKVAAVVATTAVIALGAGTALAFWTGTGSGSGTASVTTDANMTIASTMVTGLFPGATKPVIVTVQNPNAFPTLLPGGISGTISVMQAVGASGPNDCTAADFTFNGPSPAAPIDIPADGGAAPEYTSTTEYSITMLAKPFAAAAGPNGPNNQNKCKNATITITYTTTPAAP